MADEPVKGNRWWKVLLLGVILVPGLAYQNMKYRKAAAVSESAADDVVAGVKVRFSRVGDTFVYQDGTELPLDGVGYAVLAWDDYQKNPQRFQKIGFDAKEADFPVVVFFNLSGFDASGDPGVVRRARDGSLLFELKDRPGKPLAGMTPLRDGSFKVFFRDGTAEVVREEDWYRKYMGVEPTPHLPAPELLDKMTDEELKTHGLTRMTREEYEKKFGGPAPGPAPTPPDDAGRTGLKGTVVQVGGIPAVQPLKDTTLLVLRGVVEPAPLDRLQDRVAHRATSRADGTYAAALPPGVYTVVAVKNDKPIGNAVNQARWPSVKVGDDGWTEYEFRLSAR